jgi:hypothetical protein
MGHSLINLSLQLSICDTVVDSSCMIGEQMVDKRVPVLLTDILG